MIALAFAELALALAVLVLALALALVVVTNMRWVDVVLVLGMGSPQRLIPQAFFSCGCKMHTVALSHLQNLRIPAYLHASAAP